mgnify:CR=1 FL=1
MDAVSIPRHADEPPHLLLWSLDEIAPMLLGLTIGIFTAQALVCTLIGVVISRFYKRYRDNHPDGCLMHMIYWSGIPIVSGRHFPNPFIRLFKP